MIGGGKVFKDKVDVMYSNEVDFAPQELRMI